MMDVDEDEDEDSGNDVEEYGVLSGFPFKVDDDATTFMIVTNTPY